MKAKPTQHRRKFANEWDEIGYYYDKLLYWLYQREDRRKARPYAEQLETLLSKAAPNHEAIFGEECWSLVRETQGDLQKAIEHRENEIRLIRRLHELSYDTPHEEFALQDYGFNDLSDRLDLLAILYHDSGNLDKAIAILKESKGICESHGIPFDGQDILDEYEEKQQSLSKTIPTETFDDAIREAYKQFGTSTDKILTDDENCRRFAHIVISLLGTQGFVTPPICKIKKRLLTLSKKGKLSQIGN